MIFDFVPENGEFQWLAVLKRKHKKPNSWSLSPKLLDRKTTPYSKMKMLRKFCGFPCSNPILTSYRKVGKKILELAFEFQIKKETSITLVLIGVK